MRFLFLFLYTLCWNAAFSVPLSCLKTIVSEDELGKIAARMRELSGNIIGDNESVLSRVATDRSGEVFVVIQSRIKEDVGCYAVFETPRFRLQGTASRSVSPSVFEGEQPIKERSVSPLEALTLGECISPTYIRETEAESTAAKALGYPNVFFKIDTYNVFYPQGVVHAGKSAAMEDIVSLRLSIEDVLLLQRHHPISSGSSAYL